MKSRLFIFLLIILFLPVFFILKVDRKNRLNLALVGESVAVLGFEPGLKEITFLIIPKGTLIETVHGYGFYRVEKLLDLDRLDNWKGEVITGSLGELLGLPIDGYLIFDKDFDKANLLKALIEAIKNKNQTNLSRGDLLRLWWQIKKIRPNKITLIDFSQTSVCIKSNLADNSQVFKLDQAGIDQLLKMSFKDEKIIDADLTIFVLNGTSHLGLANRTLRMITNMGGQVVGVGDWKQEAKNCELRAKKAKVKIYTSQKLMKIFNCHWGGENLEGYRADIVLILGEDYWQKLNGR